jgi:hypothetical protein
VVSNAELVVHIDAREALRKPFSSGGSASARSRALDEDLSIDIPAGERTIVIANEGVDWIRISSVKLEQVRPAEFAGNWKWALESIGLRNGNKAVLYVNSPWVIFPAGALRYNPPLMTDRSVKLASWPAGSFSAQWFDPRTGKEIGATQGATAGTVLTLPLPAFRDDLVAIVTAAATDSPTR